MPETTEQFLFLQSPLRFLGIISMNLFGYSKQVFQDIIECSLVKSHLYMMTTF